METKLRIIGMHDICEMYNLTRKEATKLLNTKGCPLLPRVFGAPYKTVQDEFENWLRQRRAE